MKLFLYIYNILATTSVETFTEQWDSFCAWWINDGFGIIISVVLVSLIGYFVIKLIIKILEKALKVNRKKQIDVSAKSFLITVIKAILNIILAIIILNILHVNMTTVAGVLSAVTVAIGLALQDIISSFASGVILLNSKNFKTGDYISIDGVCEGTVKNVRILATILEDNNGHNVIIPNGRVNSGIVINYTYNLKRRIDMSVGVHYNSDIDLVKATLLEVFNKDKRILKDPTSIVFVSELADSSIDFSFRCWTSTDDYWDVKNGLYEEIVKSFNKKGIVIPYNTIVINTQKD